jgi:2',3'-cyclic-nucleotide 2'-phosphodiesterase (5'-nucleotidase family)
MPGFTRILILAALLAPAAAVSQPCDCRQYTGVILLEAGGLPGRVETLGKLAWLADSLSREYPYVFVISPGNNLCGSSSADSLSPLTAAMIGLMNRSGFDACAVGVQDTLMGRKAWAGVTKKAKFPLLSCDYTPPGSEAGPIVPYTVLRAGKGNRIVLLGITRPGGSASTRVKELASLKKKYPVLIALGHMTPEEGKALAREVPELDDVIGAYSDPGTDYIGKITLVMNEGKIMERRDELVPMSALTRSDRKVEERIHQVLLEYNNLGTVKL